MCVSVRVVDEGIVHVGNTGECRWTGFMFDLFHFVALDALELTACVRNIFLY